MHLSIPTSYTTMMRMLIGRVSLMDVNWRGVAVLVLFFEVSGSVLMLAIVSTRVKSSSHPSNIPFSSEAIL